VQILEAHAYLQRLATILGWTLELDHFFVSMFGERFIRGILSSSSLSSSSSSSSYHRHHHSYCCAREVLLILATILGWTLELDHFFVSMFGRPQAESSSSSAAAAAAASAASSSSPSLSSPFVCARRDCGLSP
jgi:hypothetical protein